MVTIRFAKSTDPFFWEHLKHDGIVSKLHRAIEDTPQYSAAVKTKEHTAISLSNIGAIIRDKLFVVAEHDGKICGVVYGEEDDGPIWLSWITVDDVMRKQGVGEALLRGFLKRVVPRTNKVWCSSLVENRASAALLTKCGFREIALLRKHWHGLDFILWEKTFKRKRSVEV